MGMKVKKEVNLFQRTQVLINCPYRFVFFRITVFVVTIEIVPIKICSKQTLMYSIWINHGYEDEMKIFSEKNWSIIFIIE